MSENEKCVTTSYNFLIYIYFSVPLQNKLLQDVCAQYKENFDTLENTINQLP